MAKPTSDTKREEFRKYLERGGVMDALTKVLVGLYEEPEKPNDSLEYMRQHLGATGPSVADVEATKRQLAELREKCDNLEATNQELRLKLQQLEANQQVEGASAE